MSKVYCKGCRYCKKSWFEDFLNECTKYTQQENYTYKPKKDKKPFFLSPFCEHINANNDCPHYTKKPWWMFWRG